MASPRRRRRRRGCQKGKDGRTIGFCEKPLSFPPPGTTTATTHEPPQRGINIFRKKAAFCTKRFLRKRRDNGGFKKGGRELSKNCYCLFFAKRERERDRKNLIRLFACSPLKRMRERGERNLFPFGLHPFVQKKKNAIGDRV